MNFDIFNINKELELLNKKINSNNIVDNNYSNNVIKIEEKKELEFIITEINSDISKTFESELSDIQKKRKEKKILRKNRRIELQKDREKFLKELAEKKKQDENKVTIKTIGTNTDNTIQLDQNEVIQREIQLRVDKKIEEESINNKKIEEIKSKHNVKLNEKNLEIQKLLLQLNDKNKKINEQVNEQNKKINEQVEKELIKRRENDKIKSEINELEKKKKLVDRIIKEQQVRLKKETNKVNKRKKEIVTLDEIKKTKINDIVEKIEDTAKNNEKYTEVFHEGVKDFRQVLLQDQLDSNKDLENRNPNKFKRTMDALERIKLNKRRREERMNRKKKEEIKKGTKIAEKSKLIKHNINDNDKKDNDKKDNNKKDNDKKNRKFLLENTMTHIFSDKMININNSIFDKLLLKFVIFRNTSFEFFDQNNEKMFTILFRKDFIIDFYKYKIVKRVKEGIKTKKLVLCDIISINNQFKLWSIAWNGLRSINKDNFYENLIINKGKYNDYKIYLPNDCSFEYNRTNSVLSSFKTNLTSYAQLN